MTERYALRIRLVTGAHGRLQSIPHEVGVEEATERLDVDLGELGFGWWDSRFFPDAGATQQGQDIGDGGTGDVVTARRAAEPIRGRGAGFGEDDDTRHSEFNVSASWATSSNFGHVLHLG